jgi:Transposase and inactivated derivatives
MRYVKLKKSEKLALEKACHIQCKSYLRDRIQCLLLSNQGYSVPQLADIYSKQHRTIRNWFTRWERSGLSELMIRPGRGLKPAIKMEDSVLVESIIKQVKEEPQNIGHVVAKLNARFGLSLSVGQLRHFLKRKLKYRWRRLRKCIKCCQDPFMYEYLVSQLCMYMLLEEQGKLDICYGDESGFSLDPCIPYGWQPPGEYTGIVPANCSRLNVFGILSRDNHLNAYSVEGTINTDIVIACIDDFVKTIKKKTVLVLDNASIHHSVKFKSKLGEWIQKGLRIFHLPAYSPHLNLIETLWRKIKYQWLKPADYASWESLKGALKNILNAVGDTFKINFEDNKYLRELKQAFI